jgi:hypothetical protein
MMCGVSFRFGKMRMTLKYNRQLTISNIFFQKVFLILKFYYCYKVIANYLLPIAYPLSYPSQISFYNRCLSTTHRNWQVNKYQAQYHAHL